MDVYYTVAKITKTVRGAELCTGRNTVWAYEIIDNEPKSLCHFELDESQSPEAELNEWLEENVEEIDNFDLTEL